MSGEVTTKTISSALDEACKHINKAKETLDPSDLQVARGILAHVYLKLLKYREVFAELAEREAEINKNILDNVIKFPTP